MSVRRIADLPFAEKDGAELLGIDGSAPDEDFYGFGYFRLSSVILSDNREVGPIHVEGALVFALHSPDDGDSDEFELEFFVDVDDEELALLVPLTAFLEHWLPKIHEDKEPVILALCNSRRQTIGRPPGLASAAPLYFAHGDVHAWLDGDPSEGPPQIGLAADQWNRL